MHPIQQKVSLFLTKVCQSPQPVAEELIQEFGEACKNAIRKQLTEERDKSFRLRLSNVGKPLRQLMLEKEYGQVALTPETKRMMMFGDLIEALEVLLMKASGIVIESQSEDVKLKLERAELNGTLDVVIDGKVYDIKSCSPWSFANKFVTFHTLADGDDPFGYVGQGFAYAQAKKTGFGGWITINKVNGDMKVVEVPESEAAKYHRATIKDINEKVNHILDNKPIPECDGVVTETYYRVPTGEKHLNKQCEFCPHKDKCHPKLTYRKDEKSTARVKPWKYYLDD